MRLLLVRWISFDIEIRVKNPENNIWYTVNSCFLNEISRVLKIIF